MTLVYALPVVIVLTLAWLAVRGVREHRRERALRERLARDPRAPKLKSRSGSERSQMRASDDPTTVLSTLKTRERASSEQADRASDGTRSKL